MTNRYWLLVSNLVNAYDEDKIPVIAASRIGPVLIGSYDKMPDDVTDVHDEILAMAKAEGVKSGRLCGMAKSETAYGRPFIVMFPN